MKKTDSSIDLHCHTTASDGAFSPTQIVERAIKREITHLAISDHDTTLGIKEAKEAALKNYPGQIQIIPAIEVSTSFLNKQIQRGSYCIVRIIRRTVGCRGHYRLDPHSWEDGRVSYSVATRWCSYND